MILQKLYLLNVPYTNIFCEYLKNFFRVKISFLITIFTCSLPVFSVNIICIKSIVDLDIFQRFSYSLINKVSIFNYVHNLTKYVCHFRTVYLFQIFFFLVLIQRRIFFLFSQLYRCWKLKIKFPNGLSNELNFVSPAVKSG